MPKFFYLQKTEYFGVNNNTEGLGTFSGPAVFWIGNITTQSHGFSTASTAWAYITWTNTGMNWYSSRSNAQANETNIKYFYIAFL